MAIIVSNINNQVEKLERIEILEEFTSNFINYLRDEQLNLKGFKILYELEDIKEILDNVLRASIINESEHTYFDEKDMPF